MFLCLFSFFACDDDGEHIKLNDSKLVAPVLSQEVPQNFILTETTNMTDSIGLWKWSVADYGVQTPPIYVLEVDTLESFGTFQEYASLAATSLKITNDVINKAAMLFVNNTQEITLYFRVRASIGSAEVGPILYSDKVSVSFSCVYIPDIKPALYIIGDGLVGWSNDSASIGSDLQVFFADDNGGGNKKYTYTGFFKGGNKLKFTNKAGDWTYGASGNTIVADGPDYVISGSDGLYTLDVDLKALTLKMTPYTGTVNTYTTIGLVGDAADGWPNDDAGVVPDIEMTQVVPHVWVLPSVSLQAGKDIKFRANKTWNSDSWGAQSKTEQLPYGQTGGENIRIETAGDYYIALSDITGHYIVIQRGQLP